MSLNVASRIALLSVIAFGAAALSACGSITAANDGGTAGGAGTTGVGGTDRAGTGGATARGGAGGSARGGTGGIISTGGTGGITGTGGTGGAITCHVDLNDCPTNFTCACGGPGVGTCTCHRNCTDATQCGTAEPMCGCPSTTGDARFCVNACFCNCQ